MKIEGEIDNEDYVNCFKFTVIPPSIRLKLFQYFTIFLVFSLSYIFVIIPQGGYRYLVGFIFAYIMIAVVLLVGRITFKIWTVDFIKFAESNNVGKATYEIIDDHIDFKGSMYECKIPIASVKDVMSHNGTHYLKFGNYSGFIVPRKVSSGSIDEFIAVIKSHNESLHRTEN